MKKYLQLLLLSTMSIQLFGQASPLGEIETKIENIAKEKTKLETAQGPEDKTASELFEEIKKTNDAIIKLSSDLAKNKVEIEQKKNEIEDLNKRLDAASKSEQQILLLNKQLADVNKELEDLKLFKANDAVEKAKIDELLKKGKVKYNEDVRFSITKFLGTIEGWSTMSGSLEGIAVTSASVLIFDEKTNKKVWRIIKKEGLDLLTITSGVISINGFQGSNQKEGITYAGLGIAFKTLQSLIKDTKIVESISRNVAFADEIRAYAKLTTPLDFKVSELYKAMPKDDNPQKTWFPERSHIDAYKTIVDLMDQIQVQNMLIKNKAEFLKETGTKDKTLSDEGVTFLENVQKSMEKAITTWTTIKPVHEFRIRTLQSDLSNREKDELGKK